MGGAVLFCLLLAGVSVVLSIWAIARDTPLEWRFAVPEPVVPEGAPVFETVLDYTPESGQAHSPGIVVEEGGFRILWFEGSAEAQADVDVLETRFKRLDGVWQQTQTGPNLTRARLSAAMEPAQIVVTLGNTIENEARAGGLWATVASVGGWAMASVVDVAGDGPARRLDLSPILGRSNLVKSPMVAFADGSMGLPAYFEMGSTFGLLARFDADGRVRDTRRIGGWGKPIQPMIVPLSETRAVAFLRDFEQSKKLLVSRTEDGGQSWSPVEPRDEFNPSSPVAALGLGGGRILIAMNDLAEAPDMLRLVLSEDEGDSWQELRRFEKAGALRYPMLRRLGSGEIVLSYSKGTKKGVVAHVFNQAWVEAS
ncbi:MAG: exo-alpha-sialidase [Pseudomonadota bacterium]